MRGGVPETVIAGGQVPRRAIVRDRRGLALAWDEARDNAEYGRHGTTTYVPIVFGAEW